MKSITSIIVGKLNESIDKPVDIEVEDTAEVNKPKVVYQCDDCSCFYVGSEDKNESICECGGMGHPVGKIDYDDEEEKNESVKRRSRRNEAVDDEDKEEVEVKADIEEPKDEFDDEEAKEDAEELADDALKALDECDYKKFKECYSPRVRMTSKGKLEAMVECKGHIVTASKRMTSRQKASYKLAESYNPKKSKKSAKKMESIKIGRQKLIMKNESRLIKNKACSLLEKLGVKYNFKKFNEEMDDFLKDREFDDKFEDILQDDEMGAKELDTMTPDEIEDQVKDVIEDTGLEVLSTDSNPDGEATVVDVRINDVDNAEVKTSELQEVLSDVFDAPVEIAGPVVSEGDDDIVDLKIIINPEGEENLEENVDEEKIPSEETVDDLEIKESFKNRMKKKVKESIKQTDEDTETFALVSVDDATQFLGNDNSIVDGNDDDAEMRAKIFSSADEAEAFMNADDDIAGAYRVVKIKIEKKPIMTQESVKRRRPLKK